MGRKTPFWLQFTVDPSVEFAGGEAEELPVDDIVEPDEAPAAPEPKYTEADLAAARAAEKQKLYPDLERLKTEMAALKAEREAEEARLRAEQEAAAEAARIKAEEEMEVRELLRVKEQEWQQQLEAERQERERFQSMLEKERQYAELQNYRAQRLAEVQDEILPELIDLVGGNSVEEIEASIAGYVERTSRILGSVQQATELARREMSGARVTAPSTGPLDTYTDSGTFTPDQLRDMPMDEYTKHRATLLRGGASSSGLFG